MKRIAPLLTGLVLLLTLLLGANSAWASHFRAGTISWTVPDPQGAPLTVQFTVQTSWQTNDIGDTNLMFGDSESNGDQTGTAIGTGADANSNSYTVQEYTVSHTYAAAGQYLAFFEGCCRVDGLANVPNNTNYRVESTVDLSAGNSAGPTTAAPAVIQLQLGAVRSYDFPLFDADGDVLGCRFPIAAESGGPVAPAVPNGGALPTLAYATGVCTLSWDLALAVVGEQYAVQVVMESTHNGIINKTAVDLIIEIVSPPPPSCSGSGQFVAPIGQAFSATVVANDIGGMVTRTVINQPPGSMILPAAAMQPVPVTNNLNWTPSAADGGTTRIVLLQYTNALNLTGTCYLSIFVPQCTNYGQACSAGVGICENSGTFVCAGTNDVCDAVEGTPGPVELCDNLDNDCDGDVDEGNPGGNSECNSGLMGICAAGITSCETGGNLTCVPNVQPAAEAELCDNLDNDCDGEVDEDNPQSNEVCSTGLSGVCEMGLTSCEVGGNLACLPTVQPGAQMEVCDSVDNDCDGVVDEDQPQAGQPCDAAAAGVCAQGVTACDGMGEVVCVSSFQLDELPEICDGLDNDCDGEVDEFCGTLAGSGFCTASGMAGGRKAPQTWLLLLAAAGLGMFRRRRQTA